MIIEIKDVALKINRDNVMELMDCHKESDVYEEMLLEYEDLKDKAIANIEPIILIGDGELSKEIVGEKYPAGSKAIFNLISIGNKISEMSTLEFDNGDYVAGMLLNSIADDLLFQLDNIAQEHIIRICKDRNIGISKRLEAPNNIDIEVQKEAWIKTEANQRSNIKINSSYMFYPVKTSCQIYLVDNEKCDINTKHNCDECNAVNCKMRNINYKKLTILDKNIQNDILVNKNETIMEALIRKQIYIPAICAGRGVCGKCAIRVIKGNLDITKEDNKFFSKEELKRGNRLSCRACMKEDITIKIPNNEEDFLVLTSKESNSNFDMNRREFNIVIDIGTTTIAMQSIDIKTTSLLNTYTSVNHQRKYGADVINRINASNNGKKEELKKLVVEDLKIGINKLIKEGNQLPSKIIISANTTMIHLLMGYPCDTLGIFPFKAYSLELLKEKYTKIFGESNSNNLNRVEVQIIPSISTFVGGDIVSGIIACDIDIDKRINLFLDLGTNGEIAIGNKDKILVTSTAAGPAFEGGNIKYGVGSVEGAISSIEIAEGKVSELKTIGDKDAVGICGTGVVEIVYELLRNNLIDETGLMNKEYFDEGYLVSNSIDKIYFTAKDVREIQLAKSAIRAGIETLIKRFNVNYKDINKLYVAGGFGYKLDAKKAMGIGMFPLELEGKIEAVGNTSLEGARRFAVEKLENRAIRICDISEEINLNEDKDFNNFYMEYMYFDEE